MKKLLTLFLSLTLIITTFCSCGCSMDDGEAGDKGNIQTDDVGDGGTKTDGMVEDKDDKNTDKKDSVTDDLKDGVDSTGRAIKDGINAIDDTMDGAMNDMDRGLNK